MTKLGRSLGSGKFRREDRGGGAQWILDYKDASGKRHRQALGPDKRVAERRRAEIISQRDLEEGGLGPIEGQSRPVSELVPLYLDDLRHRVGESQIANVPGRIERVLRAIRAPRVRDIKPIDVIRFRNELLKEGASNRTANLYVDALKAMLNWAVRMQLIAENPLRNLSRLPTGAEHQRH
ncbi:MAG: hypothetical protein IPK60_20845 [Sandaracinaceae bacterium]|nr:hypothetical protein [Sandaracinaceae bacterium]